MKDDWVGSGICESCCQKIFTSSFSYKQNSFLMATYLEVGLLDQWQVCVYFYKIQRNNFPELLSIFIYPMYESSNCFTVLPALGTVRGFSPIKLSMVICVWCYLIPWILMLLSIFSVLICHPYNFLRWRLFKSFAQFSFICFVIADFWDYLVSSGYQSFIE